jgi:hypothetical protein
MAKSKGVCTEPISREFTVDGYQLPIVVTIDPSGVIIFREKTKRTEFSLPVGWCYLQAVKKALS